MDFMTALSSLKEGNALCRSVWTDADGYLKVLPGMDHVWKIMLKPSPNAGNYIFSIADLEAQDWQLFSLVIDVAPEPEPIEAVAEVVEAA